MEIVQLISEQTPAVALAILVLWFYPRLTLDYLRERKEWLDSERQMMQQLLDSYNRGVEAMTAMRDEMHALKGRL